MKTQRIVTTTKAYEQLPLDFCSKLSIEFEGLYSILQELPEASNDTAFIDNRLRREKYEVTNWGRGNWEGGPRFIQYTFRKGECFCNVYKKYHYHERITSNSFNLRVTEHLICNSEQSMFD